MEGSARNVWIISFVGVEKGCEGPAVGLREVSEPEAFLGEPRERVNSNVPPSRS